MSHHPSSAELRAFRRSIEQRYPVLTYDRDRPGAWPHEREHGIGYGTVYGFSTAPLERTYGVKARREAAAMRSRAYARLEAHRIATLPRWANVRP